MPSSPQGWMIRLWDRQRTPPPPSPTVQRLLRYLHSSECTFVSERDRENKRKRERCAVLLSATKRMSAVYRRCPGENVMPRDPDMFVFLCVHPLMSACIHQYQDCVDLCGGGGQGTQWVNTSRETIRFTLLLKCIYGYSPKFI